MSGSIKETEYLQLYNECEILSLEISRDHKALNEKKARLDEMDKRRKQLRVELVGPLLEEATAAPALNYPAGARSKPQGFV